MAIHERVWERPDAGYPSQPATGVPARLTNPAWRPMGTYGLMATMGIAFVLQIAVSSLYGVALHDRIFPINPTWWLSPWTLITSTFSHGGFWHIFVNGLVLYFFGPHLERLLGTRRFVLLFVAAGAISGILQVALQPGLALGASGAINMVFGALVMIMPRAKVLLYGIIPLQFWLAGTLFVALDVLGALGYGQGGIGNFAHLSGFALGLWLGARTKRELSDRGIQMRHPS